MKATEQLERSVDQIDLSHGTSLADFGLYDDSVIDHTNSVSVGSEATIVRVTSNGSISLPASIRRRWGVDRVAIIDRGDLAVVRAVPPDPVGYFRGRFGGPGPNTDELRAREAAAEESAEQVKATRAQQ